MCYTVLRQCVSIGSEGDGIYEALLPSSPIINTVLQYVWALWEDPVDVSLSPSSLHPIPPYIHVHMSNANMYVLCPPPLSLMQGIRHQCKVMFENVIGICQQLQKPESGVQCTYSTM